MSSILKKAKDYKRVSSVLYEGEAHLNDKFTSKPQILKSTTKELQTRSGDDVSQFPRYQTTPMPESIPYPEGKYRPPSIPNLQGYLPYNIYLHQGKVYNWCSCGMSNDNPWCNGICNFNATRCRPITFNVDTSGYYKLCNCKQSANAPFCNGTHMKIMKYYHSTHRGFYEIWGLIAFYAGFGFMIWNYYT